MRFTGFYMASSICTPSRAGMLTGCYPQRLSMNRVLFRADSEGLHPGEETIAALLKREGYATALAETWRRELGDAFTGTPGTSVRDCGRVEHPKPLAVYNPGHPYIVAEYDLTDRG